MTKLRQTPAPIVALLLLCMLWALAMLRFDLFPHGATLIRLSLIAREASLLGLLAAIAALAALILKTPQPQPRTGTQALLVGLGLFVAPLLLTEFGKPLVTESTRVALFSLTPLFAVVIEPYLGGDTATTPPGGFVAAMTAVVGSLLVFPIEIPLSAASFLAFCAVLSSAASIAVANCLGVRACQQDRNSLSFATIAAASASVCLATVTTLMPNNKADSVAFDAWAALDLLALVVLFWVMPRMSAVRMTTRFLIAPLLANLVGIAILRPYVPWQAWLGFLLIATASGWLLLAPAEMSEESRTPLRLD